MPRPSIWPEWMDEAACSNEDNDTFFPPDNDYSDVEKARKICKSCPVWRECLSYAVTTKQPYGVWAGSTPYQRRGLRVEWRRSGKGSDEYKGSTKRR